MLLVAHLSDLHLDLGERAHSRCEAVLEHLRALSRPVDVLLVTGDIANHGAAEEYAEALDLLGEYRPLILPGNHDDRAAFRAGLRPFVTGTGDGPVHQVHRRAGVVFVLLDSTIPGRSEGELSAESLEWLDSTLDGAVGKTVFVALHHPPVELGNPGLDAVRLRDGEKLGRARSHVGRRDVRRTAAAGRAGRPLDAAAALGDRPVTGLGRRPGPGLPPAQRHGPTQHPLPGGQLSSSRAAWRRLASID
jgi:3',5'-cyclic AMP phosphodiesterase CpdA